jgi:hypothetical protein
VRTRRIRLNHRAVHGERTSPVLVTSRSAAAAHGLTLTSRGNSGVHVITAFTRSPMNPKDGHAMFAALAVPNFRRYVAGQSLSLIGLSSTILLPASDSGPGIRKTIDRKRLDNAERDQQHMQTVRGSPRPKPRCPLCACRKHTPRLPTAVDQSTHAAVSPGIGEAGSRPQPELPGAVLVLPCATAGHRSRPSWQVASGRVKAQASTGGRLSASCRLTGVIGGRLRLWRPGRRW